MMGKSWKSNYSVFVKIWRSRVLPQDSLGIFSVHCFFSSAARCLFEFFGPSQIVSVQLIRSEPGCVSQPVGTFFSSEDCLLAGCAPNYHWGGHLGEAPEGHSTGSMGRSTWGRVHFVGRSAGWGCPHRTPTSTPWRPSQRFMALAKPPKWATWKMSPTEFWFDYPPTQNPWTLIFGVSPETKQNKRHESIGQVVCGPMLKSYWHIETNQRTGCGISLWHLIFPS